jgi:hypothetical protein
MDGRDKPDHDNPGNKRKDHKTKIHSRRRGLGARRRHGVSALFAGLRSGSRSACSHQPVNVANISWIAFI